MSRRTPRCATAVEDGDALRDFAAFLRGEITAGELDERSRP